MTFFSPIQLFFLNIIIIFREQFPLLELYEWQQRLGLKIKTKQTGKLIACMCVCLGLIMGAVDRSHHRTGALIGEASRSFYGHTERIRRYWAHDWLGLMAICHANDGVANRFGVNEPPFTLEKEGSGRSEGN